jgi:hypothetical protein
MRDDDCNLDYCDTGSLGPKVVSCIGKHGLGTGALTAISRITYPKGGIHNTGDLRSVQTIRK